jgi:putative ABC transport system substrate-binding protein
MRNRLGWVIGWALVVVLVVAMLAGCGGSKDEKKPASYTIGILNFVPQLEQVSSGFKEGMAARGYVEGENLTYIQKFVDSPDKLGPAAQELVDAKVDLILATGTLEAQAAQQVTTQIPIVFGVSSDPIGAGLVETIARPGKNVTGVMMRGGDQRRLQLLIQASPSIKQVYVPYNPDDIGPAHMVEDIQGIAGDLGVTLVLHEVHTAADNAGAVAEIPADVNAIFLGPDDIVLGNLGTWLSGSMERGLPISVPMAVLPDNRVLMGYGPDLSEMGKQATNLAVQILKGSAPNTLPVETADLFLTVSLAAAEQLDITVADPVLSQARTIIYPQDANASSG